MNPINSVHPATISPHLSATVLAPSAQPDEGDEEYEDDEDEEGYEDEGGEEGEPPAMSTHVAAASAQQVSQDRKRLRKKVTHIL